MKYKYDAFISYRHTELDRFAAENLHRQMEAFRLPGKLSGKTGERTKVERVFRDKDELPLTDNLEDPIMKALAESEYLIVICSPRLRESLWCRKEIETFIRIHGREKVLAVLIEGEPADSFPEELLYAEDTVTEPDGSIRKVRRAVEPLAADIRGRSRREMLKMLRTEKLRLLAPMFSLNYDDLRQRHRERRMKRILKAALATAAVFLCFGAFSTAMALRIQSQNRQLEEQKERLEEQKGQLEEQAAALQEQSDEIRLQNEALLKEQALNLAEESLRLLEEGDRQGAVQAAVRSLTEYQGIELPYTALGEYALTESLHIYDNGSYIKPSRQMETEGVIRSMQISPDGQKLLTCDDTHTLILWDIATGSRLSVREDGNSLLSDPEEYTFLDNDRIAYLNDGGITIYHWKEDRAEEFPGEGYPVGAAASGNLFAVEYRREIRLYRADTLVYLGSYITDNLNGLYPGIHIDEAGKLAIFQESVSEEADLPVSRRLVFWNAETGNISRAETGTGRLSAVCYAGNRAYVLCNYTNDSYTYTETVLTAYNTDTGEALWTTTFNDCSGSKLFRPDGEETDSILVITSQDARLVGTEDGQEYARFSMGSTTAGGAVLSGGSVGDVYIVYTRSGEYHTILADKRTDYVMDARFQSHSQNVKEFYKCAGGFLVLPYQDNRVTLYTYSGNPAYEARETPVEEPSGEYLDRLESVRYAEENGLAVPARAEHVFFSGDGAFVYVCYNDGTLRIYDAVTFELKSELALQSSYLRQELGVDERGNRFVSGGGYGYMLSPGLELLAVIENLTALDSGQNRLIVKDSAGVQYGIPIYTVEELLDNARGYVLSCNCSESEEAVP
ncbi:MAG: TIR domain-containing protein [Butyrivibrio sp.]|nr:TIR domain-containing protein [Acetatifactor muris]MCM1559700.1 TIR domain-containing protein [Butyrivibrio sp.]